VQKRATAVKHRNAVRDATAEIGHIRDPEQIDIEKPHSANAADTFHDKGALSHSSFALQDKILPAGDMPFQLPLELRTNTIVLVVDNASELERFHPDPPSLCYIDYTFWHNACSITNFGLIFNRTSRFPVARRQKCGFQK
jgi:hypothetical protein